MWQLYVQSLNQREGVAQGESAMSEGKFGEPWETTKGERYYDGNKQR